MLDWERIGPEFVALLRWGHMIGKNISHYQIVEELGSGGMAVVYRAIDRKLKRTVALKLLAPDAVSRTEKTVQFIQEARAAAALDHPNICAVYEIDECEDAVFIAMPFVEGGSLKGLIAGTPMDFDRIVPVLADVARGLEAAHRLGIVHRDITSDNIMVTADGLAKITDFGLATLPGVKETADSGIVAGTPAYMSPEQVAGETTDARTDIWGLGVCLYEMLTGRLPFAAEYAAAIQYAVQNETPLPVEELRPETPEVLRRVVEKAMAKNPDDRYQTASDLLAELSALADPLFVKAVGRVEEEGERRSIAVMPFVDMSPGQDQGHFCDGIAEEVINALAQVEDLRVAARTSSFAFKGAVGDIRSIGQQLGVEAVLEGSLRKADSKVRITAQLVDVADGCHIWSRQYDRELDDILAIQADIAREITAAMELEVKDGERQALEKPRSSDAKAYDLYLRGREYFYKSKRQGIKFAIGMFERAIGEDPNYALAYAGLADCHSYLYMYFGHAIENLDGAEEASRRAVELDPGLAEAHAARGLALNLRSRWEEAESEFEKAIELNSSLFEAYYFYGRTCFAHGKLEKARDMYRAACRVSPHDYQAPNLLAFTYNSLKEFDKATAAYRIGLVNIERRLETHPDDARAVNLGALALVSLDERDLAIEWGRHSADLAPDDPYILYGVACIFGRLRVRLDDGLEYFGKAIEAGFAHKEWIEQDEDLDPFRKHPLFRAIVERLK